MSKKDPVDKMDCPNVIIKESNIYKKSDSVKDGSELYRKNCVVSKTKMNIESRGLSVVYEVGFQFVISPISEMFMKQFEDYVKVLAQLNKTSLDPNLNIKDIRGWQQKRKHQRLNPNEQLEIEVRIDNEKYELMNISKGGIRIRTKKMFQYGEDPMVTIKFPNHEINLTTKIANISTLEDKKCE